MGLDYRFRVLIHYFHGRKFWHTGWHGDGEGGESATSGLELQVVAPKLKNSKQNAQLKTQHVHQSSSWRTGSNHRYYDSLAFTV